MIAVTNDTEGSTEVLDRAQERERRYVPDRIRNEDMRGAVRTKSPPDNTNLDCNIWRDGSQNMINDLFAKPKKKKKEDEKEKKTIRVTHNKEERVVVVGFEKPRQPWGMKFRVRCLPHTVQGKNKGGNWRICTEDDFFSFNPNLPCQEHNQT